MLTTPNTLEELVNKYYEQLELHTVTEEDIAKYYKRLTDRYEHQAFGYEIESGRYLPHVDETELQIIEKRIQRILTRNSLGKYFKVHNKNRLELFSQYHNLMKEGYREISESKKHYFTENGFCVEVPLKMQVEHKKTLREKLIELLQEKCDLLNAELVEPNKALEWAENALKTQEAEYRTSLTKLALEQANKAAERTQKPRQTMGEWLNSIPEDSVLNFSFITTKFPDLNSVDVAKILKAGGYNKHRTTLNDSSIKFYSKCGVSFNADSPYVIL